MSTATRRDVIASFIPASPLVGHLGIEVVELVQDRAVLRMPFRPELATMGDVVHGGAIAALADTAGMAATWADDAAPTGTSGSTVSMAIQFASAARGEGLVAEARARRRGRTMCFCDVEVRTEDGADLVATALVTQRFGG